MARQCYTARASCAPLRVLRPENPVSFHPSMGTRPKTLEPACVSLIIPGLVWPGSGINASLKQLDLPALASLLGHGATRALTAQPWSEWLAARFGAQTLPWAALRLAGDDLHADIPSHVLCADPVSLGFTSNALLLRGPHELSLQADEVSALIATLNAEFADLGHWHAASPERFYLVAHAPIRARFHPLTEVLGRPVAYFPPEGEEARRWNQIANEVQICLHNHPISQARSARGQLAPNALWFWGQSDAELPTLQSPAAHLYSADPLLRGLAHRADSQVIATPDKLIAGLPGHSWLHDGRLQDAAHTGDFNAWLGGLQTLEREYLQPLLAAWKLGRIRELVLEAPSDKLMLTARLPRHARWAFWRKPLPSNALGQLLQAPTERSAT